MNSFESMMETSPVSDELQELKKVTICLNETNVSLLCFRMGRHFDCPKLTALSFVHGVTDE